MTIIPEVKQVAASAVQLFDGNQVQYALKRVAEQIAEQTRGEELVVQCVMNGGLFTTALLVPHIPNLMCMDYVHASRYRGNTYGGQLQWKAGPNVDMRGHTVLVVDDIFDEGHTLKAICDYCTESGASTVLSAVLVNKEHDRKVEGFVPDFIGLNVPDRYVFGSGMDYKGYLRNHAGIYAVADL